MIRAEGLGLERFGLRETGCHAEHLAPSVAVDADRKYAFCFPAMSLLPSALNANRITVLGWPKLTHSGGSCSTPTRCSCKSFSAGRTCSRRFLLLEWAMAIPTPFLPPSRRWEEINEMIVRRASKIFIKWRTALASTRSSRRPDLDS